MTATYKKILPYIGIPLLAALYLAFNFTSSNWTSLLRAFLLIGFGYVASYTDLKTRKVSNRLILYLLAAWAAFMSLQVITDMSSALQALAQGLISGFAAAAFFMFVYLVSRKGIGGGDVKLISVMGLYLTFTELMQMLFFCSLLTVIVSVVLLITKRATMKTAIPLAPFLYAGVLIILFM